MTMMHYDSYDDDDDDVLDDVDDDYDDDADVDLLYGDDNNADVNDDDACSSNSRS